MKLTSGVMRSDGETGSRGLLGCWSHCMCYTSRKKLAWRKVAAFSWIWTLYFWTAHQRYSLVGLRQASLQPELLDRYWIPYLPACVCAQLLHSCLTLCNPVDCSPQAPLSMAFSKQEYWNGLAYPPLWIFPTQGSNSCLLLYTWVIYLLSHLGNPIC